MDTENEVGNDKVAELEQLLRSEGCQAAHTVQQNPIGGRGMGDHVISCVSHVMSCDSPQ